MQNSHTRLNLLIIFMFFTLLAAYIYGNYQRGVQGKTQEQKTISCYDSYTGGDNSLLNDNIREDCYGLHN